MRVLLVAEEAAGIQVLRALHRLDHEMVAVMASPSREVATGASMWEVARKAGHDTWPAEDVQDASLADRLREHQVDLVLNVHSLYVVHAEALAATRFGWYNLHPGPLPRYAGLNTVSWAIYNGEHSHGVTLHRMAPTIDAGPIVYEESILIEEDDTGLSLAAKCVRVGVQLVLRLVDAFASDPTGVPAIDQDPAQLRYFGRAAPDSDIFSWDRPAQVVVDHIRAFDYYPLPSPWGFPRAKLGGQVFGVLGARRTHQDTDRPPGSTELDHSDSLLVACADEWIRIRRLHSVGRIIDASQVARGKDDTNRGRT